MIALKVFLNFTILFSNKYWISNWTEEKTFLERISFIEHKISLPFFLTFLGPLNGFLAKLLSFRERRKTKQFCIIKFYIYGLKTRSVIFETWKILQRGVKNNLIMDEEGISSNYFILRYSEKLKWKSPQEMCTLDKRNKTIDNVRLKMRLHVLSDFKEILVKTCTCCW